MKAIATNSKLLNLYKVDPKTDGDETFNIKTMLNDNWDRIEAAIIPEMIMQMPGVHYTETLVELGGGLDEWTTDIKKDGVMLVRVVETESETGWTTQINIYGDGEVIVRKIIESETENGYEGRVLV